jgi:ArsR family transcriptional regulator, arsenate/arsenite/antimonite-responsive transcriptional repressor / arsenate reductase (thioredoxin)
MQTNSTAGRSEFLRRHGVSEGVAGGLPLDVQPTSTIIASISLEVSDVRVGGVDDEPTKRARIHAALAEPVRLVMCDRLLDGDLSPGELGEIVDLPTNLLAHHLKVLAVAGVIRRVRSEGDRRRWYVQLCWQDPDVARIAGNPPGGIRVVPRVVFVCTHNSARSQLAAAAWAGASSVPATSAGTHPAARVHPRAVRVGRRHGLHLAGAGTRDVAATLADGDLVVAVCDNAHEELSVATPGGEPRADVTPEWLHWAVPDPARLDTDQAFEAAFTDLTHRLDRLARTVTNSPGAPALLGPTRPEEASRDRNPRHLRNLRHR